MERSLLLDHFFRLIELHFSANNVQISFPLTRHSHYHPWSILSSVYVCILAFNLFLFCISLYYFVLVILLFTSLFFPLFLGISVCLLYKSKQVWEFVHDITGSTSNILGSAIALLPLKMSFLPRKYGSGSCHILVVQSSFLSYLDLVSLHKFLTSRLISLIFLVHLCFSTTWLPIT